MGKTSIKLIANNKKAYHDFFIEDTLRPAFPFTVRR